MNWGFVIRRLRQERGLTQLELAQASGVGRPNLSRIELGQHKRASREMLEKFARGLSMPVDELSDAIYKKTFEPKAKDALDLLKKLQVELQSVPVYSDFPFHAGSAMEPTEYVYRAIAKGVKHHIEGYKVVGTCLTPVVEDGDLIIVDRERSIDNGDIVACIVDGELHIARVQKVANDLWLENNHGKLKFQDCQASAPVIEIVRRLK
jgi:transcriptional regulator with XRE-family HTH domain